MTRQLDPARNIGKGITRGAFPKQARSLYVPLDFTLDSVLQGQLPIQTGITNVAGIDMIQSMFIDNSDNSEEINIVFDNNFEITCPPYAMGIFPLLLSGDSGIGFIATSSGGVFVKAWFTNTREQPAVWVAGYPIAGTINVTGSVLYATPTKGAFVDASATYAGPGSEQLIAADGNRIAWVIKNPATPTGQGIAAPEPVYINFGAAAAIGNPSSIELLPGETISAMTLGLSTTQVINWIAATVGHQLSCKVA